jgi:Protein of unknown function (DUF2800)
MTTIESHTLKRPSFGRSREIRGHDCFDTPPEALAPLFVQEPLLAGVTAVSEPFCGLGNLVLDMRARGLTVFASDLLDRGCPDSTVLDFKDMTRRPCDVLISNPPYARSMEFIEHALALGFQVIALLLPVDFLCTADRRERLHKPGHLRRVHLLAERLQGMHDAAHLAAGGKKAGQSQKHAWFVLDATYRGPAVINPVSLHQPAAMMPWRLPMNATTTSAPASPPHDEPVHSRFGGSNASRVLRCPASVTLVAKVPAHQRKSSTHAERGTVLHAAMRMLIERACTLDALVGKTIDNYTITGDDVATALRPVLAYVDALLDAADSYYLLEQSVKFPGVDGAFGTCDLIVRVGNAVFVIDFKFGAGVLVRAIYPDGAEDVLNSQLMFYGTAGRFTLAEVFAGVDSITLTILQPQSIDVEAAMESSVVVTHAELDEFIVVFRTACEEALAPEPRLQRGDHCRFCPAQPICPAHRQPLLDLSQFENVRAPALGRAALAHSSAETPTTFQRKGSDHG